jgi:hypothetical protein
MKTSGVNIILIGGMNWTWHTLQGLDLVVGNLGDSRAVMATRDAANNLTAVQLTVDLKPNLPSMLISLAGHFTCYLGFSVTAFLDRTITSPDQSLPFGSFNIYASFLFFFRGSCEDPAMQRTGFCSSR